MKTNNTITNNCMSKDNTLNLSITHTSMSDCIIFENMTCSSAYNLITKYTLENRTQGVCETQRNIPQCSVTVVELTVLQSEQHACLMNMQEEGYEYSPIAATSHSYCGKQCV